MNKKTIVIVISTLLLIIVGLVIYFFNVNKININTKEIILFQNEDYDIKYNSKVQYSFSSNSSSVATIDKNGKIHGVNEGKTTITVKTKTDERKIDVYVNPSYSVDLELNREFDLDLENYKKTEITDKKIIDFDNNKVKGLELGESSLILKIDDKKSIKYNFNIVKVSLIDFTTNIDNDLNMYVGENEEIKVIGLEPTDTVVDENDIEIISSNKDILEVENNNVKALKKGEVTLTINYNDVKKEYNIKVTNVMEKITLKDTVTDVKLVDDNYYVLFGRIDKDYKLDVSYDPIDAEESDLIYSSSDNSVAVFKNNTLSVLKSGYSDITIKTKSNNNLSIKVKLLVSPESVYSAKTYSKINYIKKFTSSSQITWKYDVPENSTFFCAQSMILSDKYVVINQISSNNLKGNLTIVDRNTFKKVFNKEVTRTGHSNGATYNYKTKEYLIAPSTGKNNLNLTGVYSFNLDLEKKDIVLNQNDFLKGVYNSRMAYDKNLNIIVSGDQTETVVYDYETGKVLNKIKSLRANNQDLAIYNGVIYRAHSGGYVDTYRIMDGAYLGSYYFDFFEIEDLEIYDDKNFLLLFYRTGTNVDKLYMTNKMTIYN